MAFLVLSCSLNPNSRSRVLARAAVAKLEQLGAEAELVDLQALALPFCDGQACYDHPAVGDLKRRIADADGILMAVPIYNFDVNSAAKNLVELTGDAWHEKIVGFLCAAGGQTSFMSIMGLANSLMLDFQSVIVPRFVYINEEDIVDDQVADARALERVDEVVGTLVRFARGLNPVPQDS